MGNRDRVKIFVKGLGHPSTKVSASKSASNTSGTLLEPRPNEPTDTANGTSLVDDRLQDAPVRDLWALALENLPSDDKESLSRMTFGSKLDVLRHLQTAAVKKRSDCEDQRWKFELRGQQIILRDVAEKIIVWINKFKQFGDIAVNCDPVHASLPWAGIKFLLEVGCSKQ